MAISPPPQPPTPSSERPRTPNGNLQSSRAAPTPPLGDAAKRAPSLPSSQRPSPAPPIVTSTSIGASERERNLSPPAPVATRAAPVAPKKLPSTPSPVSSNPGDSMRKEPSRTGQPPPSPAAQSLKTVAPPGSGARPRQRKDHRDDSKVDIVKRLQQICTDSDPTKLYRNLVKIGQG